MWPYAFTTRGEKCPLPRASQGEPLGSVGCEYHQFLAIFCLNTVSICGYPQTANIKYAKEKTPAHYVYAGIFLGE